MEYFQVITPKTSQSTGRKNPLWLCERHLRSVINHNLIIAWHFLSRLLFTSNSSRIFWYTPRTPRVCCSLARRRKTLWLFWRGELKKQNKRLSFTNLKSQTAGLSKFLFVLATAYRHILQIRPLTNLSFQAFAFEWSTSLSFTKPRREGINYEPPNPGRSPAFTVSPHNEVRGVSVW